MDNLWMGILCALEEGQISRAEVLESAGISARTLKRRLARARMIRDEIADEPDDTDPIHLEVVAGHAPRGPGGEWYSLADDAHSLEGERISRALITDGRGWPKIRRLWAGEIGKDEDARPDAPATPTAYRPDPRLKGGLG